MAQRFKGTLAHNDCPIEWGGGKNKNWKILFYIVLKTKRNINNKNKRRQQQQHTPTALTVPVDKDVVQGDGEGGGEEAVLTVSSHRSVSEGKTTGVGGVGKTGVLGRGSGGGWVV